VLEAKHLRVERDSVRPVEAGGEGLVDKRVGFRRLLCDGRDGVFQDVTLPLVHNTDAMFRG
jgi:hypothetical protein